MYVVVEVLGRSFGCEGEVLKCMKMKSKLSNVLGNIELMLCLSESTQRCPLPLASGALVRALDGLEARAHSRSDRTAGFVGNGRREFANCAARLHTLRQHPCYSRVAVVRRGWGGTSSEAIFEPEELDKLCLVRLLVSSEKL